MSDRRWQYALLLLFSPLMAVSLAGSHLRNTFGNIDPADDTFKNPVTMGYPSKDEHDAPVFKVSSQEHFSFAEITEPRTASCPSYPPGDDLSSASEISIQV
ncbi:MAG: hypothetical protein CL912_15020 [Deltaproteobacteria bacterium]|nr:hypothetical protein [Deltaproteobacteria bacterium]